MSNFSIYSLGWLLFLFFGSVNISAHGQSSEASLESYESCMKNVSKFSSANLVAEALLYLEKAQQRAKTSNEVIRVIVVKGELLRSTQDYQHALETLWSADQKTVKSCDLIWRIKHLGRLAAVHQEYGSFGKTTKADSVIIYIDSALALANLRPTKFQSEIASLNNEVGLYKFRKGFTQEARNHYTVSCRIFNQLGEKKNLVTPLSNLLELESCARNFNAIDPLKRQLETLIAGKDWYAINLIAYNSLRISASVKGDSIGALRYELMLNSNAYSNSVKTNSDKMLALREIYEHDKLQRAFLSERSKRKLKAKELIASNENRKRLIIYLSVALVIGLGIVLLFIREWRLKQRINVINEALNLANERYQLVVIESNHRIKNNLQMVTAMMQYTSKGLDSSNTKVLNSFSSKINAISALHKHLYVNIHNEFILVSTYFNEIIKLYQNMSPEAFHIDFQPGEVAIRSERIVYFGLIFNEMLSNTLEHSPETMGQIRMYITETAAGYTFYYSDNSVRAVDFEEGMGSTLIRNLSTRVGGKNFQLSPVNGAYSFDFTVKR